MRVSASYALLLLFSQLLVGCYASLADTLRARAAVDFRCQAEAIAITELPGSAYQAAGCGASATYSCSQEVGGLARVPQGEATCMREGSVAREAVQALSLIHI